MASAQVESVAGLLRGTAEDGVLVWRGIPYAAPPVGPLRFRPPSPVKPWPGVRDATRYGPQAVQFTGAPQPHDEGDEDCLTLNVWAPAAATGPVPVLVWIHGGAFLHGSGRLYDGAHLARRGGVAVVTLNYRLGPLGFNGPAGTANPALLDLVAALEWVRDNIAAFGGDPGRVTLSGQSAGGMLTSTLLAVPAARGLFHRALVLSGSARNVHSRGQGEEAARRLRAALGAPGAPGTTPEELTGLPVQALREAAAQVVAGAGDAVLRGDDFRPVVDGDVLPRAPLAAVADGEARGIPLWIGHVRHEMDIFLGDPGSGTPPVPLVPGTDAAGRDRLGEERWAALGEAYAASGEPGRDPHLDLLDDAMWWLPAIRLAEAQHAAGGQVWFSRFDHTPGMPPYDRLGPTHGADNRCLWGSSPVFNNLPGLPPAPPMGPADLAVTGQLQAAVLGFVRGEAPDWPAYEPGGDRATRIFQDPARVEHDPRRERRLLWRDLPEV
ncbi:carboxylesterase/lipase family protein [Streptomyces sp. NBC_01262]|uniref:carboxylesterase/lipase family protein n=1 Tax=Streptomyces sp. NBC_01262 TaxID=2903803 RepID=UPI002E353897|nr:carboxylesterase family protein [Streptomyces sp. NBC_01262]